MIATVVAALQVDHRLLDGVDPDVVARPGDTLATVPGVVAAEGVIGASADLDVVSSDPLAHSAEAAKRHGIDRLTQVVVVVVVHVGPPPGG